MFTLPVTALAVTLSGAAPAPQDHAQDHGQHQGQQHAPAPTPPPGRVSTPASEPAAPDASSPAQDHDGHWMASGSTAPDLAAPDHAAMGHAMPGMAQGEAGMAGMSSGSSRLPAAEPMHGLHVSAGGWALMAHGYLWGVYTDQGGPRGDAMAYVGSMAMLTADRVLGESARLQLRTMLSAEPAMGRRGYPNLFATGETAFGEPLVDRQHPHDLFMELAARIDVDVAPGTSAFVYGGPVGEPALGPPAFMHRGSARFNPDAPITHHWFDSTHITYGVVTAGLASRRWQVEASAFRGREPDEERWGIETPRLDSWSVRATWLPSDALAIQASYGFLKQPEALHPDEDERRFTASATYTAGPIAATLAYSAKNREPGPVLGAWLAEANWAVTPRQNVFGRFELVENDELFGEGDPLHHDTFRVGKATLGYAYDVPLEGPLGVAVGGSVSLYPKPDALDAAYGDTPVSLVGFVKLSLK